MDALANGRRIKCLTIVDDFSREWIDIAVDHGIGGEYVTRVLERAGQFRGYPQALRTDQGPEFTSRALLAWLNGRGIKQLLTDAGSPTQNAYIESFNGKFRDECLNEQWFESLRQAREEITHWRRDYDEAQPHSSIGRIPPAKFAAQHKPARWRCCAQTGDEVTCNPGLNFPMPGTSAGGRSDRAMPRWQSSRGLRPTRVAPACGRWPAARSGKLPPRLAVDAPATGVQARSVRLWKCTAAWLVHGCWKMRGEYS